MRSAAPAPVRRSVRSVGAPVIAALLALGGAVTGCASSGPAPAPAAAPSVDAVPTLATADGRALPIARFLISPDEDRRIEAARTALIGSCMKRFGFDYAPPALGTKPDLMTRRYYLTDAASAAAQGYHWGPSADQRQPSAAPQPPAPELQAVLGHGRGGPDSSTEPAGRTHNGVAIPPGGCLGEADDTLTRGGGILQDDAGALEINGRGFTDSMADGRVKAAFAAWSRCMKEKGQTYASPVDAVRDERWFSSPTATAPEIAAATADVDCKQRNNVVGIWFAVETAYQNRAVQADAKRLEQARKAIDVTLANAAAAKAP
ncbi:hypothetical protein SAMN05216371_6466 [Streptomyces sp. TLI_053]|uniref:hypothetical protein n=1 Tax=Streptomyces sp. TLI_053 TaxID=1855352 RepID=UPI00087BED0E|nr:hypothetical protein [Streptomyces sp. TLI_053]SDT80860.1 hypothetical protein SAMN05216371_6466 [Streptomyces sp. TLI_053]